MVLDGGRTIKDATSADVSAEPEPHVGERIRDVRKSKRIRQKVLARMVGISPGALTNFEKGRRRISLDWLHKIAEALDMDSDELLRLAGRIPSEVEEYILSSAAAGSGTCSSTFNAMTVSNLSRCSANVDSSSRSTLATFR